MAAEAALRLHDLRLRRLARARLRKRILQITALAFEHRAHLNGERLVDDVANGRVDLAAIDKEKLPEPLRELSTDEQRKLVMETQGKREALQSNIAALAEQRQQYIENELKKDADVAQSLDYQIFGAVKQQAAKKGLEYDSAPAH